MSTRNKQKINIPTPLEVFKGFTISKLAEEIGVSRTNFYKWEMIPLDYVIRLEQITGVSRHIMRPDFYK
jgi:hypothetical protein